MPLWNTLLWQKSYFLDRYVQLTASLGIRSIGNFYLAYRSFLKKGRLSGLGSSLPILALIPLLLQWQTPSSALFLQEGDFCHLLLPMGASWSATVQGEQRSCATVRRRKRLETCSSLVATKIRPPRFTSSKLLNFEWWEVQKAAHFIKVQSSSSSRSIFVHT